MEENKIFQDQKEDITVLNEQKENVVFADGKKPLDVASLVLGIVAAVFSLLIPLVTIVCGIVGLVLASKCRMKKRTTAARVLCIVALAVTVIFTIIAVVFLNVQITG